MDKYANAFLNIVDCLNDNDLSDECKEEPKNITIVDTGTMVINKL